MNVLGRCAAFEQHTDTDWAYFNNAFTPVPVAEGGLDSLQICSRNRRSYWQCIGVSRRIDCDDHARCAISRFGRKEDRVSFLDSSNPVSSVRPSEFSFCRGFHILDLFVENCELFHDFFSAKNKTDRKSVTLRLR